MKKKHHYRMLFVLLAAGLLCSCGTAAKKEAQMCIRDRYYAITGFVAGSP